MKKFVFLDIRSSFEERARCIREISKNRVQPTTFEQFCCGIFAPGFSERHMKDFKTQESLHRTFSLPTRANSIPVDVAAHKSVMDLLDTNDGGFRSRASSALSTRPYSTGTKVCEHFLFVF